MQTVKPEGMIIEGYDYTEFEDCEEGRHESSQRVILSLMGFSFTKVEDMKVATIRATDGRIHEVFLQQFSDNGAPVDMRLNGDEMRILVDTVKADQESRSLTELRGLYDALLAENADLKEAGAVYIENQIEATKQIERLIEIKNELDDECLRLMDENAELKKQIQERDDLIYQANTSCSKAVNHAERLELRARELLSDMDIYFDGFDGLSKEIQMSVTRLELAIDTKPNADPQRHTVDDGPDELATVRQENDALKRRVRQLQYVCMQAWANIESGHADRSLDALDQMHPYENDPYGLERLPAEAVEA